MPLHELLLQEIQQFVDQANRQLREASAAYRAVLQARWQALAVPDDLATPPPTTPDNGEPAYATRPLTGYNPLTEDFHAWRAARLARLQALDARLEILTDDAAEETAEEVS